MAGPLRLQRVLAAAGIASRRGAEVFLREGRVRVNGRVAALGERADPDRDDIRVDGRPLRLEPLAYWLLHKPPGVLSTRADPLAGPRRLVVELLPEAARRLRLFPVGRLDAESEGLVLLTNDGPLAHALLHPSREVDREYVVDVRGRLADEALARLRRGVELADGVMRPVSVGRVTFDARSDESSLSLVLREGRKREIRRAFEALGHPVVRLVRVRFGPLRLGALESGAARELEAGELRALARLREPAKPAASPGAREQTPRKARAKSRPRARSD